MVKYNLSHLAREFSQVYYQTEKGDITKSDVREKLRPFVGKRIKVRGGLSAFKDWMEKYRNVGRACISFLEMEGEVLADHVWVMGVPHWLKHKADVGKQVEFNAIVKPYADTLGTNFNLVNPGELVFLHDPPALTIPDPPEDEEISPPESIDDSPSEPDDPLEKMRQAKRVVKACGSLEHPERIVEEMQTVTLPLPQLLDWIRALKD